MCWGLGVLGAHPEVLVLGAWGVLGAGVVLGLGVLGAHPEVLVLGAHPEVLVLGPTLWSWSESCPRMPGPPAAAGPGICEARAPPGGHSWTCSH